MSIEFYSIKKVNPRNGEEKYYASHRNIGTVDLEDLADEISRYSSFVPADVHGLLEGLTNLVARKVAEGYLVELGNLGTFGIKINSRAENSDREVDVYSIKGTTLNYKEGSRVKQRLKQIHFVKNEKAKKRSYRK